MDTAHQHDLANKQLDELALTAEGASPPSQEKGTPPPLPRRDDADVGSEGIQTAELLEPTPPPVTAPPLAAAEASDPAAEVVIHDFRPHWTHRLIRYLQPSAGFGASLIVHVSAILLLGALVFHQQIVAPFITITATTGEAETDALVGAPFELTVPVPEMDTGALESFADLSDIAPEPLGELPALGSESILGDSITGAISDAFGGKSGELDGLYDDTFDGMIDYARDNGLDMVIVFDSTGSMGGEIQNVKDHILTIGGSLLKKVPSARISLVTYRDVGDEYEVKGTPLTRDLRVATKFLNFVRAGGGGDNPEAVEKGLQMAVKESKFRASARKVILVFGDAPPHAEQVDKCVGFADEFHRYDKGVVTMITVRNSESIPEFTQIAKAGGGSAFGLQDSRLLMEELLVQVFGDKHRHKALEFFGLPD